MSDITHVISHVTLRKKRVKSYSEIYFPLEILEKFWSVWKFSYDVYMIDIKTKILFLIFQNNIIPHACMFKYYKNKFLNKFCLFVYRIKLSLLYKKFIDVCSCINPDIWRREIKLVKSLFFSEILSCF